MICGKALIIFGAWTALRVILTMLLGNHNLQSFVKKNVLAAEAADADLMNALFLFLFVVVLIICLISFLINYIAGHGAYVEGKTRKKGVVYIIVTVLLLLLTGFGIVSTFLPEEAPAAEPENQETLIDAGENTDELGDSGSLLMDLTQLFLCADILYSVYKARKLSKELGEEAI
jgi:heme/copper-type cytochrome/quinol oxidase subunit 2